ncbi:hypothetical protein LR48_Vigan07g181900 [Vigna angularis]|uniref:Uncharacterized protein n=1 Tax=Phaseolus angularis TaxID=3914 RepID=A0A0L9UZ29_PHAAN|nr:hypothetical protein LR48_Vigan07g181900 [Vigna angularis]
MSPPSLPITASLPSPSEIENPKIRIETENRKTPNRTLSRPRITVVIQESLSRSYPLRYRSGGTSVMSKLRQVRLKRQPHQGRRHQNATAKPPVHPKPGDSIVFDHLGSRQPQDQPLRNRADSRVFWAEGILGRPILHVFRKTRSTHASFSLASTSSNPTSIPQILRRSTSTFDFEDARQSLCTGIKTVGLTSHLSARKITIARPRLRRRTLDNQYVNERSSIHFNERSSIHFNERSRSARQLMSTTVQTSLDTPLGLGRSASNGTNVQTNPDVRPLGHRCLSTRFPNVRPFDVHQFAMDRTAFLIDVPAPTLDVRPRRSCSYARRSASTFLLLRSTFGLDVPAPTLDVRPRRSCSYAQHSASTFLLLRSTFGLDVPAHTLDVRPRRSCSHARHSASTFLLARSTFGLDVPARTLDIRARRSCSHARQTAGRTFKPSSTLVHFVLNVRPLGRQPFIHSNAQRSLNNVRRIMECRPPAQYRSSWNVPSSASRTTLTFSLERSSLLSASTFSPLRSTRPLDNSCVRASKQPDFRPHPAETNARHSMWTSVQTAAARPRLYIRTLDTQCGRPFNKQTVRHLPSESNARQSVGVRTFKHWAVRFQPLILTFGLYRSTILQYERSHIRPITSLAFAKFRRKHSVTSSL